MQNTVFALPRTTCAVTTFLIGLLCFLFVSFLNAHVAAGQTVITTLKITEIMYHPPDEGNVLGTDLEFLELKNVGTTPVDLSGLSFTDGIIYTFPGGRQLQPGQFFVLASNPFAFQRKYAFLPDGIYEGQLSNSGENLEISDFQGNRIVFVSYGDAAPWPAAADGLGFSLVPVDPNPTGNQNNYALWRASRNIGGSPKADDPSVEIPAIVVNEVLANSTETGGDAIELYNPTDAAVDIGGWYITDNRGIPMKYRIPAGTLIPAGGYLVFTESQFNPTPGVGTSFAFSANGEQAYLYSAGPDGALTGYSHGFSFDASPNGISFGRRVSSEGREHFPLMSQLTLGAANAEPRVGPLVISEIMYHPAEGGDEFLEIANITDQAVKLFDENNPLNTWSVGGIGYSFPGGLEIPARGAIVISSIDPQLFRTKYNVPASVQIVGPYTGALQNDGENLELRRPANPDGTTVPVVVIDAVRYNDRDPWPEEADGFGPSLVRIPAGAYGNDPIAWRASTNAGGSPGVVEENTSIKEWMMH